MSRSPGVLVLVLVSTSFACGGRGGQPPERPPVMKGPDGKFYHLLDRGAYKGFYDAWGRLSRLEYDSNGDGAADHIAHHDGQRVPHLIEVDQDFDGRFDRWEEYSAEGTMIRIGASRKGDKPDVWVVLAPGGGAAVRQEYDDDGDGRIERAEDMEAGIVVKVELDTDRDGRFDRWQIRAHGRMVAEEIDSDGDGKPDRRIRMDERGRVEGVERLPQAP